MMQNEIFEEAEVLTEENQFYKNLIKKLFVLWPWIIASIVLCLVGQYLILRYSTPQYKIHASVLVQDEKKGSGIGESDALMELGLLAGKSNVENEVEIFKSRSLMTKVVHDEKLNIKYLVQGKVKETEAYDDRPIDFQYLNSDDSLRGHIEFLIEFEKSPSLAYSITTNDQKYKARIGDTLSLPEGKIVVRATKFFAGFKASSLKVVVVPVNDAVRDYSSRFSVGIPNKQVSVINLTLSEALPKKGEVVVDAIISAYLQANVNDKNQIADSTMRFLEDRLVLVSDELSNIEKNIEGFKFRNKLTTNLGDQARILLDNAGEYEKQQVAQEVQLSIVNALETFLKNNINDGRIVPSSLIMQDASFIALVQGYNELQLERDKMLMSVKPEHPSIITMNEQLKNLRLELLSSISSIKRGIEISVSELKRRSVTFERQVSKMPATERVWLDFERQQAVKQELYLFLLKKREETAISRSSTLANARIIDSAKSELFPFKPQRKAYFVIGILIGIIIPFAISYTMDLLNTKVRSMTDISQATHAPILAEIGHNVEGAEIAVKLRARSIISEQFRTLRTNLNFLLPNEDQKVILVTSSMSGEGKSFLSINLCAALAIAGKKVILIESDLRKPKISETLKLNRIGLTNYLVDRQADWKQLIQSAGVDSKFDILASGPLPPNPAELLMLPKMKNLLETLKESYDYIIIDSAPVGLVTDAQILAPFANATLYVVRHGFTYKQQIKIIERMHKKRALPVMNIIVNDVQHKKNPYGYGYGYGYSPYGYGGYGDYGTYGEDQKG